VRGKNLALQEMAPPKDFDEAKRWAVRGTDEGEAGYAVTKAPGPDAVGKLAEAEKLLAKATEAAKLAGEAAKLATAAAEDGAGGAAANATAAKEQATVAKEKKEEAWKNAAQAIALAKEVTTE
jgi:hypothetical protein